MIMVCSSMAELFIQYKIIWIAFKSLFHQSCVAINTRAQKRGKPIKFFQKHGQEIRKYDDIVEDPAKPEDQVKDWMWILGLVITIVLAMVICQLQWVSIHDMLLGKAKSKC